MRQNKSNQKVRLSIMTGLFLFICSMTSFAQTNLDQIIGIWETEDKDGKMEVFKSGDEYHAKLLWGKDIVEEDGKTSKKDVKNPDPKLRSRDLAGITYITGLKYDEDEEKYMGAKIYSSADGDIYKGYVWMKNGQLLLRGYLGFTWLGQTTKWNRLK